MKVAVVIEIVMLEEVDREITKKDADNVAGNILNLYSAKKQWCLPTPDSPIEKKRIVKLSFSELLV